MMNLLVAFLAFDFIVLAHELGHFIVAKLSGIKVLEFSLFVGPKLYSFQKGETTYSLRLIPILAYVKMEGEEEESTSERAFNKKPVSIRAAVIAAGPLMNLLVAIILLFIVFSITGFDTTTVSSVDENSPAYIAGIKEGDRITAYDGKNIYKPVDVYQFLYVLKDKPVEIEFERDGEKITRNYVPQVLPEQERYLFGFTVKEISGDNSNVVQDISPKSPAELGGLRVNDRIIGFGDTAITSKQEIDNFMKLHQGGEIEVTVLRNGEKNILTITPRLQTIPEQYYAGMTFTYTKGGFFETLKQTFLYTHSTVRSVPYSVFWLVSGQVSISQLMGPVGMVVTIGEVVDQSRSNIKDLLVNLMNITGLFSIALGATNLLPLPALDGNKLLLLAVEKIRKKPIPPEKEALISMVGIVLIMGLAVIALYNDIMRLVNG